LKFSTVPPPSPDSAPRDLTDARAAVAAGRLHAESALTACLAAARAPGIAPAFLSTDPPGASLAARQADQAVATGLPPPALAGLAVSIKDLYDVQGHVTAAGSRVLQGRAPAEADALAVARLRAAGAALIGRTHMTEFAFSGIGLNPHHATPENPVLAALGRRGCIPGGSTSGGAVTVAGAAAWAALGSDTGGSIRIPAALHGLVGFKNTQRLTPTAGSIPLSVSLDTACAITRSVRDAILLHEVLASRRVHLQGKPLAQHRFAVAKTLFQDDLAAPVAHAFEAALRRLREAGATIDALDLPALADLPDLQAGGGLAAAEAWAWHRDLITRHESEYDPRVAWRIRRGEAFGDAQVRGLHAARRAWIERMGAALIGVDAVLSPTVPIPAPTLAELADDDAFFRANALMLRNPSVVNLLDGCALTLPCQAPGDEPVGLMLWQQGGHDDALLDAALAVESALGPTCAPPAGR
jgi:amidase/aspartyl-tRNA(Asn)/glutamyl-tRNA(Gln) amidotransferase subunit A